jgi:hypothetical protein
VNDGSCPKMKAKTALSEAQKSFLPTLQTFNIAKKTFAFIVLW